jgi:hypothetical protein
LNPQHFCTLSEAFRHGINRGPCMSPREPSRPAILVALVMPSCHSLSGVLHGRRAAVRSRSAKNIWRLADHCRQSSVDLGVEMILGGGALCSRRHLINPTHRDYPRFLSTNAYSYWLCASLCTICLVSIVHLVFETNCGQRAVCWRAPAARPGYN